MTERQEEVASALPAQLDSLPRRRGFRLRGIQMTRLETFTDAAFAFAVSMLVIAAQQIPDNMASLLAAFGTCQPLSRASRCSASFGGAIGCGVGGTV